MCTFSLHLYVTALKQIYIQLNIKSCETDYIPLTLKSFPQTRSLPCFDSPHRRVKGFSDN